MRLLNQHVVSSSSHDSIPTQLFRHHHLSQINLFSMICSARANHVIVADQTWWIVNERIFPSLWMEKPSSRIINFQRIMNDSFVSAICNEDFNERQLIRFETIVNRMALMVCDNFFQCVKILPDLCYREFSGEKYYLHSQFQPYISRKWINSIPLL